MRLKILRPNSIRARMTLGFALFIAALMLAVCAAFFAYIKHADRKAADALLLQTSNELQRELRDGEHTLDNPAELVAEANEDFNGTNVAIMVVDKGNRVLAQSAGKVPPWPSRGDEWRLASFKSGTHTVVIGVPWGRIERSLRERTLLLLALSTLVVAGASAGAWVLVGRTLSPIDHLARQAQAASTESLRVRLEAPSDDAEIARLVQTLNDLLARLAQTSASRGRFYASASHELRTPLQALGGHLEVALSRKREAAEYESALCEAHIQADRLTGLVQDLLLLNQLDTDLARAPAVLLDGADICESELAHLRPLADERGLKIELSLPEHCELNAPWNHATMLFRNLLENAVKYATPHGKVRVQLDQSTLIVRNDCQPIPNWDADKTFEPFFRADASRNSQTGGNGLGLAICKAICHSNGWHIAIEPEEAGIRAVVQFAPSAEAKTKPQVFT